MSNFPEPDNFDGIYAEPNDHLMWDVVGYTSRDKRYQVIVGNLANEQIAEGFIRVYIDEYIKEMYFSGAQDI